MPDKLYVGNTKVKTLAFGDIINIGFTKDHLDLLASHLNENGWVNVNIKDAKSGGKYAEIDTYGGNAGNGDAAAPIATPLSDDDPDLPF